MLREFVFIDEGLISQFVSQVSGGDLQKRRDSTSSATGRGSAFKIKGSGLDREKHNEEAREYEYADNVYAAFDRLVTEAQNRAEEWSWIEVLDPDSELPEINKGFVIEGEADFTVPQTVKLLSNADQLSDLAFMAEQMSMDRLFMSPEQNESIEQVKQISALANSIQGRISVTADFPDSEWSLSGVLNSEVDFEDLDGPLRFVGKVIDVVPEGRYKSLLTLPGLDLLSRDQRRQMEKQPAPGQEANWVVGPALVLKFLAIFR